MVFLGFRFAIGYVFVYCLFWDLCLGFVVFGLVILMFVVWCFRLTGDFPGDFFVLVW